MSEIWNRMEYCAESLKKKMHDAGEKFEDPALTKYNWENHIYVSPRFRRGHVEVVDKRSDYGLFILHATVFPHVNSNSPIWGFDAVCGKSKITGAFHDFSLVSDETQPLYQWFKTLVEPITWKKERELPEWARQIFSPSMVAAGNVQDIDEVNQFIQLGLDTLDYFIENSNNFTSENYNFKDKQNRYCHYQKQNPHVVRSMVAMGYPQSVIESFVQEVLFPEIE